MIPVLIEVGRALKCVPSYRPCLRNAVPEIRSSISVNSEVITTDGLRSSELMAADWISPRNQASTAQRVLIEQLNAGAAADSRHLQIDLRIVGSARNQQAGPDQIVQ